MRSTTPKNINNNNNKSNNIFNNNNNNTYATHPSLVWTAKSVSIA